LATINQFKENYMQPDDLEESKKQEKAGNKAALARAKEKQGNREALARAREKMLERKGEPTTSNDSLSDTPTKENYTPK
jgi:hypothetical protein